MIRRAQVGLLLALLALARGARADRVADAEQHFSRAALAFQQGDYVRAARGFQRAFSLAPHADTAFNAALAWEAAGEEERAAEAFEEALALDLATDSAREARRKLRDLRARLCRLEIPAPRGAEITVAGRRVRAPVVLYVQAEPHVVTARLRSGERRERRVSGCAGRSVLVRFLHAQSRSKEERRPVDSDPRLAGWIVLGIAGGASAAATYLEIHAAALRADFNGGDRRDPDARATAAAWQGYATAGWVATGVIAAAGVVVLASVPSAPRRELGIDLRGAWLRGEF